MDISENTQEKPNESSSRRLLILSILLVIAVAFTATVVYTFRKLIFGTI